MLYTQVTFGAGKRFRCFPELLLQSSEGHQQPLCHGQHLPKLAALCEWRSAACGNDDRSETSNGESAEVKALVPPCRARTEDKRELQSTELWGRIRFALLRWQESTGKWCSLCAHRVGWKCNMKSTEAVLRIDFHKVLCSALMSGTHRNDEVTTVQTVAWDLHPLISFCSLHSPTS